MAAAAMPAISIAHAEGVAIALAVLDPTARVGIDVEPIIDRPATFLVEAFTPRERALLDRWTGPSRSEWIARFWCAKVAAAKASGMGLAGRPAIAEVVDFHEDTGVVHVRLAPEGLAPGAENAYENPLRVISARRGQRAWAWTIRKGINS
jgi:phosphopantetheinyl transferase